MKYCANCGAQVENEAVICPYCGSKQTEGAARGLAAEAATLKKDMPGIFRVQVMQSAIKRLRSYYRYQAVIWIDTSAEDEICPALYEMARRKTTGKVTVFTEINPQQML